MRIGYAYPIHYILINHDNKFVKSPLVMGIQHETRHIVLLPTTFILNRLQGLPLERTRENRGQLYFPHVGRK
jgi:hypothetical protein